jgi:hypothetical protein
MHRVNYDKLIVIPWEGQLRRGPEWLRSVAPYLRDCNALSRLRHYDHVQERDLSVLDSDEVVNDESWKELKNANEKCHSTGPNSRRRTVVFSSLALLGNAVWCQERDWEVSASTDGTDGMSRSSYKLIWILCGERLPVIQSPGLHLWRR